MSILQDFLIASMREQSELRCNVADSEQGILRCRSRHPESNTLSLPVQDATMHGCFGSATKCQTSPAEGTSQATAAATGQQAPLHRRHEVEGGQAIQVISLSAKDWR